MLKLNTLDDCSFGTAYLFHPKSAFDEIYSVGFQFKSNFCVKSFIQIQDVMKIWHAF